VVTGIELTGEPGADRATEPDTQHAAAGGKDR
jgi:hypothetical protein